MSNSPFQIRHGEFHDVDGRSQKKEDILFVPAKVSLFGESFKYCFPLHAFVAKPIANTIVASDGSNASWTLGRLKFLFGTSNPVEEERGEKTFLIAGFLAVFLNDGNLAIPFECSDSNGNASLIYSSEDAPSTDVQLRIAKNFWDLLLACPSETLDYEDRIYHPGTGRFYRFGMDHGEPFVQEE